MKDVRFNALRVNFATTRSVGLDSEPGPQAHLVLRYHSGTTKPNRHTYDKEKGPQSAPFLE